MKLILEYLGKISEVFSVDLQLLSWKTHTVRYILTNFDFFSNIYEQLV